MSKFHLAQCYLDGDRVNEAISLFKEVLKSRTDQLGAEHQDSLIAAHCLAEAYGRAGDLDAAVPLAQKTFERRKKVHGDDERLTVDSMLQLGNLRLQRREYTQAEALLLEAYQVLTKRPRAERTMFEQTELDLTTKHLLELYEESNQPEKATEWRKKLESIAQPVTPEKADGE